MATLSKRGQISGIQAFLLGLIGVAIFLTVGLMVLTSLHTDVTSTTTTSYGSYNDSVTFATKVGTLSSTCYPSTTGLSTYCSALSRISNSTYYTGLTKQTNLSGHYPFDLNYNDYSPLAQTGTGYNTTATTGKYDGAFSFNGVNSYIDFGNSAALLNVLNKSEKTISVWVYTGTPTQNSSMILTKSNNSDGWELRMNATSGLVEFVDDGAVVTTTAIVLATNKWVHLTYVCNGVNGTIYVNGTASGIVGACNESLNSALYPFRAGRRRTIEGYAWNGSLDDIRIYSEALNSSEVLLLYAEVPVMNVQNFSTSTYNATITDITACILSADLPDGTYVVDYSCSKYSTASTAISSVITKLATVPTWLGIIVVVAMAMLVLGYFYWRGGGY